ncbi:MAG TPA: hypothetical protein VKV40_11195 [Ktedonobacteraceae bacterium]|nr:hypothetical protein [Ktedonobacteraceae bacterium]
MMQIEIVTLTGRLVRLEPLQMRHAPDLYEMGVTHPSGSTDPSNNLLPRKIGKK